MKQITYIEIDYNELEDIICKEYNLEEFELVVNEEWSHDENHDYRLKKKELDEYDKRTLEEVKQDENPMHSIRVILQDLVNKEVIPEGNILIKVSW